MKANSPILVVVISQSTRSMEVWESMSFAEYAVAFPQSLRVFTGKEYPSWGWAYYNANKEVVREDWDSSD